MANIRKGCEKAMQKLGVLKWLVVIAFTWACGCAAHYVLPSDGEYDFRVPVGRGKAQKGFETLFASTVKVVWTPQFDNISYVHDMRNDTGLLLEVPLRDEKSPTGYRLLQNGVRKTVDTYSKVGTGLVIARQVATNEFNVAIALTAAHVVTGPDTLRYYMRDGRGMETDVLERISIRQGATLHVTNRDGERIGARVMQFDLDSDIALLGLNVPHLMKMPQPFLMPLGKSAELDWGNFVYIVGYPRNKRRLTAGTVSLDDQNDRFYVDAAIRAGYSGGPVVAVRDGLPHFELVGLCRGATTETFRLLVPDQRLSQGTALSTGLLKRISVQEREVVEPGLGFVMGIEAVQQFLLNCRDPLREAGIDIQSDPALRMWGF